MDLQTKPLAESGGRWGVLSQVMEGAPSLVLVTDLGGAVTYANLAARSASGAVPGASAADLFAEDARAHVLRASERALLRGEGSRFEWGEHGATGVRRWFSCVVFPLQDGAAIEGCVFISTDVTELKRSEDRLRLSQQLMVDAQGVAHLGTWEWSVGHPGVTWSAELYRIYGVAPETFRPTYEGYLSLVHHDDRARVAEVTERAVRGHIPFSHDERIVRPDGSIRHLHSWGLPVTDGQGQVTKLTGVCLDVTDRVLAEDALRRLNAELEQRVSERTLAVENHVRDLEAFNSMVSHDLRSPLATIQLVCEQILRVPEEPLPGSAARKVTRIRGMALRMADLVNDLRSLARVGQSDLEPVDVDLSTLCAEIMADLRAAAPERDVDVRIAPGLWCRGDLGLVRAMMENLLDNAWKYTSKVSQPVIAVGIDGRAYFVRDNGAGFDMRESHRLFGAFQRLHDPVEFEGSGVGLTVVSRIVERHGGRIWAQSIPGDGATFFFQLSEM